MKNAVLLIFVFILTIGITNSYSQGILKRLGDRTMDKIQRKAEDKLVDELSEKLANQAVKPINSFMDSLFAESYENNTGEKYDPENSAKMAEAITMFMGTAVVPESYSFDYQVDVELKDYGAKKANVMKMLISTNQGIFGIEQEDDGKKMMMVFDNENETVASYNLESNELLAFPLKGSMMTAFAGMVPEEEMEKYKISIEKTSKTKNILGYESVLYKMTSEEAKSDVYISDKLPFSWDDSFGNMMRQFAPNFYKENEEYKIDGMIMEAKTERSKDGKKSEWKTTSVASKNTTINNADYKRISYGSN